MGACASAEYASRRRGTSPRLLTDTDRGAPSDAPASAPVAEPPPPMPDGRMAIQIINSDEQAKVTVEVAHDPAVTAVLHRRIVRLLTLVGCVLLSALFLSLVHLPSAPVAIEREWDLHRPLLIEVSACDVAVVPAQQSDVPTITYSGLLGSTSRLTWLTPPGGALGHRVLVDGIRASSSKPCTRLPFLACSTACVVTVRIPKNAEPLEIHVMQDLEDLSPIVQLRVRDVALKTLRVRGAMAKITWSSAGPTLDVRLQRTRISEALLVSLVEGGFRCDECELPATNVQLVSLRGSIAVDGTLTDGEATPALQLGVRQPMGYSCIVAETGGLAVGDATAASVAIVPPADPWLLCNSDLYSKLAFALFDTDKDSFVNRHEFVDGLANVPVCCGASTCPYAGWCDPLSWTLFPSVVGGSPSDSGFTGRADVLTNAAFLARVKAKNMTGLLPRCTQQYVIARPPSAAAQPPETPPKWGPIIADGGQITIAVRAPGDKTSWATTDLRNAPHRPLSSTAFPPDTARGENTSASYSAPADRYLGIRMLHKDAKRLREEVGPRFGDASSTQSAFIVFDVPAAPGIPASLWIYSPLPVYYILAPTLLAHLSMGSMVPQLRRYRVNFHDSSCDPAMTEYEHRNATSCASSYQPEEEEHDNACENVVYKDHVARLAAVHAGISRAIHSSGFDARRPRGELLLILPDAKPQARWWEFMLRGANYGLAQFSVPFGDNAEGNGNGDVLMSMYSAPALSLTVHAAVVMSLLASLIVALFAQAGIWAAAHEVMKTAWRDKRSKQRMFAKFGLVALPSDGVSSLRAGVPSVEDANMSAVAAAEATGGGRDDELSRSRASVAARVKEPSFNVFVMPLVFITTMFIDPLQRKYVDSVKAFIRDRCHVDKPPPVPWTKQLRARVAELWSRLFDGRSQQAAGVQPEGSIVGITGEEGSVRGDMTSPPPKEEKSHVGMADLVFQYELYCFQRGLEVVSSTEAFQRDLIRLFNCRVHASSAVLYVGCKWKEAAEDMEPRIVSSLKPSKADLTPNYLFDDYKRTLASFINEYLVVDRNPASQVLAETAERDGSRTFADELTRFCKANARREPSNVAVLYELANRGITITKLKKRTVYGLRLDVEMTNKLSSDRTVVEILTVMFHTFLMFTPGMLILAVVLYSQEIFAVTTATRMPLLWQHFFALQEPGRSFFWNAFFTSHGAQLAFAVRVEIFQLVIFGVATLVYMISQYVDLTTQGSAWAVLLRTIYGCIFWLHTMTLLMHISVTATWCLLAAVLDPNEFLPTGTAIVVAIIVVVATRRELGAAAGKLRLALTQGFEKRLQAVLKRAIEAGMAAQLKAQTAEVLEIGLNANQLVLPNGASLLDDGSAPKAANAPTPKQVDQKTEADLKRTREAVGASAKEEAAEKLMPADVFNLLAEQSKSYKRGLESSLDVAEFESLFEKLDLDISRARREQLFAFMDMSGDGRISQKEFEDGWSFLITLLVEEAVDSAGVSPGQITLTITGLVIWLLFLFAFIFLAVQGWFTAGSFESAVQSIFIAVTGFLSQRLRSKSKAELSDDGDFNGMVNGFISSGAPKSGADDNDVPSSRRLGR